LASAAAGTPITNAINSVDFMRPPVALAPGKNKRQTQVEPIRSVTVTLRP
jgi:hypothetical protein